MTTIDAPDWHVIVTECTTCNSGARVAIAPAYKDRARCGPCIRAGKVPTGVLLTVIPRPSPGQGGTAISIPRREEVEKVDPSVNYPAPEHTSRDPWPDGLEVPGPVANLRKVAQAHGWAVRVMYSRGCHPHGTTGRPTAPSGWFGVQALHPESRARVVAVYGTKAAAWSTVHLITRGEMSSRGTITDAQEFVRLCGRVLQLPSWVLARSVQRERIAAERAATRPPRQRKATTSARREVGG